MSAHASISVARLIIDEPASGPWNMAVDAAILQSLQPDDPPTLRFYRWSRPTLSLGYFQSLSERARHPESKSIDVVRRATGGGAIVHDREWTYSLSMAASSRTVGASAWLYQAIHRCISEALAAESIPVCRYGLAPAPANGVDSEPFLCFQRRTTEDLVISGYKILGSAQRRSAVGLLQHGSLLLAASPFAPQLPGIIELRGPVVAESAVDSGPNWDASRCREGIVNDIGLPLMRKIAAAVAETLKWEWGAGSLSSLEHALARQIQDERFSQQRWTARK